MAVCAALDRAWRSREVGGWIASRFRESKAIKRRFGRKSCLGHDPEKPQPRIMQIWNQPAAMPRADLAVHSFAATLRWASLPRKFLLLTACRTESFAGRQAPMQRPPRSVADRMNDRVSNSSAMTESSAVEIEIATRRLMAALDALESAVERRRDADRDENELAARIQALGADRSRLADELDGALVKARKLERTNREISDRLDSAIVTIRSVLDTGEDG